MPGAATHPTRSLPTRLSRVVCLALLGLAAGCGGPGDDSTASASTDGRLVIVGGALDRGNEGVYRAVLEARQGEGPFCVIPTASGVPEESMASAVAAFTEHGADSVDGVFITTDNPDAARDSAIAERLQRCSGFWFVGGVQSRVVEVFLPGGARTPAFDAVMERFGEGAVVSGSSAGAAIMSPTMIAGGSSAGALAGGVVTDSGGEEDGEGVLVEPGMGFHDGAVYDQHFLARGRIGRLLVATLAGVGDGVGFGIDENTALVVDGSEARVVGASGVVLVDAREAEPSPVGHGGTGVRLYLVGDGDRIDMETLEVVPAGDKPVLEPVDTDVVTPDDPFARWAFLHLLHDLGTSQVSSVDVTAEGYVLSMEVGPAFQARAYAEPGVEGAPRGLSAGPFVVSLVR
jgi:cyanophycinase